MVEGAGVHPEAADRPRPGPLDGAVHEEAAGAGAEQVERHAEEGELAFAFAPEVELEQAFVRAAGLQRMDLDRGIADDRLESRLGHPKAREPQPRLADPPVDVAVPVGSGLFHPLEGEAMAVRFAAQGGRRQHLEAGHHGGDLAGRNVGIAVR